MLSFKQGGIKYHFLSVWYDSTLDWTPVSWAFGKQVTILNTNNLVIVFLSNTNNFQTHLLNA